MVSSSDRSSGTRRGLSVQEMVERLIHLDVQEEEKAVFEDTDAGWRRAAETAVRAKARMREACRAGCRAGGEAPAVAGGASMITVTLRLHTDAGLFCARLKGRHMDTIISIGLAAFGIDGAA